MKMTSHAVDVTVPPDRLFAYMTNSDHAKEWQPDLVGQPQWLTEGGLREGARFRATVDEPPRGRFEVDMTVIALTPERIAYHAEEPTSSVDIEWRITRQPNGSQVQVTMDIRLKGFLRLLAPLARPMIRRKLESRVLLLRDAAHARA